MNAPRHPESNVWALGDYHRFALATVWDLGPLLVHACGVSAGQHVLDVAAGTGNVAIRAAMTGAAVVAADLTPENFDAGRREAHTQGVDIEWIEADAQALPFDDAQFDVVTSCLGAMFAPDHHAVARELLRVCRPGGVVGMINFVPEGAAADFFGMLAPFLPALPPGTLPPLLWGTTEHVRSLFGSRVVALDMTRREYVERAATAREYHHLFRTSFGPMVTIYASLAAQLDRAAALDRDFLEFVARWNRFKRDDPVEIPYEYLLIVARTRKA
jgi:2-polyprenyl-6-hydroxyphenyl methylase/3-demethylubiquinone-9 3-methyltransferase